jgi:hypothetical protein
MPHTSTSYRLSHISTAREFYLLLSPHILPFGNAPEVYAALRLLLYYTRVTFFASLKIGFPIHHHLDPHEC